MRRPGPACAAAAAPLQRICRVRACSTMPAPRGAGLQLTAGLGWAGLHCLPCSVPPGGTQNGTVKSTRYASISAYNLGTGALEPIATGAVVAAQSPGGARVPRGATQGAAAALPCPARPDGTCPPSRPTQPHAPHRPRQACATPWALTGTRTTAAACTSPTMAGTSWGMTGQIASSTCCAAPQQVTCCAAPQQVAAGSASPCACQRSRRLARNAAGLPCWLPCAPSAAPLLRGWLPGWGVPWAGWSPGAAPGTSPRPPSPPPPPPHFPPPSRPPWRRPLVPAAAEAAGSTPFYGYPFCHPVGEGSPYLRSPGVASRSPCHAMPALLPTPPPHAPHIACVW